MLSRGRIARQAPATAAAALIPLSFRVIHSVHSVRNAEPNKARSAQCSLVRCELLPAALIWFDCAYFLFHKDPATTHNARGSPSRPQLASSAFRFTPARGRGTGCGSGHDSATSLAEAGPSRYRETRERARGRKPASRKTGDDRKP
jgi:hypothetical protein